MEMFTFIWNKLKGKHAEKPVNNRHVAEVEFPDGGKVVYVEENGQKNGFYKRYNPYGSPVLECGYYYGKLHGKYCVYREDGGIEEMRLYDEGYLTDIINPNNCNYETERRTDRDPDPAQG